MDSLPNLELFTRADSLIRWYFQQTLKITKTPGWGPLEPFLGYSGARGKNQFVRRPYNCPMRTYNLFHFYKVVFMINGVSSWLETPHAHNHMHRVHLLLLFAECCLLHHCTGLWRARNITILCWAGGAAKLKLYRLEFSTIFLRVP